MSKIDKPKKHSVIGVIGQVPRLDLENAIAKQQATMTQLFKEVLNTLDTIENGNELHPDLPDGELLDLIYERLNEFRGYCENLSGAFGSQ